MNSKMDLKFTDKQEVMDRLGIDEELFWEIIDVFSKDVKDRMNLIAKAYEECDIDVFLKNVHGIKGASANVGAYKLSDYCVSFENDIKRDGMSEIYKHFNEFIGLVTEVLQDIDEKNLA